MPAFGVDPSSTWTWAPARSAENTTRSGTGERAGRTASRSPWSCSPSRPRGWSS